MPKARAGGGWTLLQLLIVLVLALLVAAIALPAYRGMVQRGRRAEAIEALTRIARAEEGYFLEHNRYTAQLTARPPAGLGLSLATRRYTLSVEVRSTGASGFTARAVRRDAADARCARFAVNQNGIRATTDLAGVDRTDECWRGAAP